VNEPFETVSLEVGAGGTGVTPDVGVWLPPAGAGSTTESEPPEMEPSSALAIEVREKTATAQSAIAHLVCDLFCMRRTMSDLRAVFKATGVTRLLPCLVGGISVH
jgi:hypothetical protein